MAAQNRKPLPELAAAAFAGKMMSGVCCDTVPTLQQSAELDFW
jgi:hypothetical protein